MSLLQLRVDLTENGQASSQRFELEGTFYRFTFRYNGISDAWFFDLADDAGEAIVSGTAIMVSEGTAGDLVVDLLSNVRWSPDIPPGRLFAFDTGGTDTESGLDDIDDRVVLLYEEAS